MVVFVKSNKMMDSFTLLGKIISACFYALSTKDGLPAPAERASLTVQLGSISPCIAPYRLRWALLVKVSMTVLPVDCLNFWNTEGVQ